MKRLIFALFIILSFCCFSCNRKSSKNDNIQESKTEIKKENVHNHKDVDYKLFILILSAFGFTYILIRQKKQIKILKTRLNQLEENLANISTGISDSKGTKERFTPIPKLNDKEKNEIIDEVSEVNRLDLDELRKDLDGLRKELILHFKKTNKDTSMRNINNWSSSLNVLYAEAINNKEFHNVNSLPNDLAVYVLELTSDFTARFKVYIGAEKRVISRPGNLEGCETDITQGGKLLQTINLGNARKVGDKWIVETPLKVKIT